MIAKKEKEIISAKCNHKEKRLHKKKQNSHWPSNEYSISINKCANYFERRKIKKKSINY